VPDGSGASRPARLGDLRGPLSGLTVSADWYVNFFTLDGPRNRLSVGAEYLLFGFVPVRLGYLRDERNADHLVSAGAGMILPFFGVDVAYQQSTIDPAHRTFAASLKFFLDL
jgi:hypothetical protein